MEIELVYLCQFNIQFLTFSDKKRNRQNLNSVFKLACTLVISIVSKGFANTHTPNCRSQAKNNRVYLRMIKIYGRSLWHRLHRL